MVEGHENKTPEYQGKQIYDKNETGERIRRQRENLGITRQEMVEEIGTAESLSVGLTLCQIRL